MKRFLLGEPLSSEMAANERIPKWKALAVLSSDALSSVAYATEEILIPLASFSMLAMAWSMPIALAIAAVLIVITISYRQTIEAYPSGASAYVVARENLGTTAGLVAGASLLIDYVLTVAVSVAAGVENIAAAIPFINEHKEIAGSVVILLIMYLHLRGVKENARIFALPTYFFLGSFLILFIIGWWQIANGYAVPVAPVLHETYPAISLFVLLRAFSHGCAALTGIEAISNSVPMFQEPTQKNAKSTLLYMSLILGVLFLGITLLAHVFLIQPTEGQTIVSQVAHTVLGDHWFYYVVQASTALILFLAANTSYLSFPRLTSTLAKDRFLPRQLASVGDRLVFSNAIFGLTTAAICLIIYFEGRTHYLIPLYAVGVFLSFTLSQFGMVMRHFHDRKGRWKKGLFFNGLGAITTLLALSVITVTKFTEGAWVVIALIPLLVITFRGIHKHYRWIGIQLSKNPMENQSLEPVKHHTAIVPVSGLHPGVIEALRYAKSIADDVRACYVELDPEATERFKEQWEKFTRDVPFVVLKSPYRSVIRPIIDYVEDVKAITGGELITVVVPEFVTPKWYHAFLHNQTAIILRAALRFRKDTIVTSVRYHLQ